MSPRLTPIVAVLLLSAAASHAVRPAPAAPAASATPVPAAAAEKPEPVAPYELKNKSTFAAADPNARAPFWPIGWVKRKPGIVQQSVAPSVPKVLIDEKAFKVTSILIGSGTTPSLAVINGRAYSEGEFLRMPKGGPTPQVRIRVQRINDGSVALQNADQTMIAPLMRPELSERKSEELLLDPDR
jgi:hypothetical protein